MDFVRVWIAENLEYFRTMEFQSRIFVRVKNPGARIADLGGPLIIGSMLLVGVVEKLKLPAPFEYYCIGLLVLGILCAIGGRIIAKGNMFTIGLSDTDLVVAEDGVRVGNELFLLDQLTDLDFMIEGYDGAPTIIRGRAFLLGRRRGRLTGANNKIHFRADGKKHLYQFYLRDQGSMSQLGQVFRTFYQRCVPFRECNRGGPTFLFRQVRSKNELEEMKRKEGFA